MKSWFRFTNNPNGQFTAQFFVHRFQELRVKAGQAWITSEENYNLFFAKRFFDPIAPCEYMRWHIQNIHECVVHFFVVHKLTANKKENVKEKIAAKSKEMNDDTDRSQNDAKKSKWKYSNWSLLGQLIERTNMTERWRRATMRNQCRITIQFLFSVWRMFVALLSTFNVKFKLVKSVIRSTWLFLQRANAAHEIVQSAAMDGASNASISTFDTFRNTLLFVNRNTRRRRIDSFLFAGPSNNSTKKW